MSHSTTSITKDVSAYPGIKRVIPAENYRLILYFDTGEQRVFDFAPLLELGKFKSLREPSAFNSVHVSFDTIAWENGLDLDPEYLYQQSIPCPLEK